MSFETARTNDRQIFRITSDAVAESDIQAVKTEISEALTQGVREIVFAVVVGSLVNQCNISRILLLSSELARRKNARISLAVKFNEDKDSYRAICETLNIRIIENEGGIIGKFFDDAVS